MLTPLGRELLDTLTARKQADDAAREVEERAEAKAWVDARITQLKAQIKQPDFFCQTIELVYADPPATRNLRKQMLEESLGISLGSRTYEKCSYEECGRAIQLTGVDLMALLQEAASK